MKILIYSKNDLILSELLEKSGYEKGNELFVTSYSQAINALNNYRFEKILINILSAEDLKIMKFIGENNLDIKIILFGDNFLNEVISTIKKSDFELLK